MISMHDKIDVIIKKTSGYWCERICSQIQYALELSKVNNGEFNNLIESTVNFLWDKIQEEGGISKADAQSAERLLTPISIKAKSFKMICVAHAHIDMNWMWGYAETVTITLETFRTMLNLMNEYPQFKFSQSQASVYKIVEEYDKDMLNEIKDRIKEGRWEVTASTWVETDKNMPSGESLARHILYTKKYLSKLLNIDSDTLNLDFEPDTFGHNQNVPEIMAKGSVKYYYHCRGYEGHNIYRWQAPSGSTVLAYREPIWYNASIRNDMTYYVPEFCTKYGIDTMLKVYGVGDHGGGPTRRDIEKLLDMSSWPVFPEIKFGTFGEYFNILDKYFYTFPIVKQELNCIFSGCYTTQTRIKMANRFGEAKLNEAEAYSAISTIFSQGKYNTQNFADSWKRIMFNHFHDILPGSGTIDTREYAMGEFQKVLALTNTEISKSLRNISNNIDTSSLRVIEDTAYSTSEGAGVGYGIKDFGVPHTERGRGKTRVYHFFNPSCHERQEPVEVVLWDWPGDTNRIQIKDVNGLDISFQIIEDNSEPYNGHFYRKILIDSSVPAYGYNTYILCEKSMRDTKIKFPIDARIEKPYSYILENIFVKIVFNTETAAIVSLVDKVTGCELVGKNPFGIFRVIDEDDAKGMTAWIVGRYMNFQNICENIKITGSNTDNNSLRQWISYEARFRRSNIKVTISLDYNSTILNYDVECDWQEVGEKGISLPQLNFHIPLGYKCNSYKYDIAFGSIIRQEVDMDVPANSWTCCLPELESSSSVFVVTDTKYGFRGFNNSISVDLIRSSYDPDPYPDNGIHKFRLGLGIGRFSNNLDLINKAYNFNHPISAISVVPHEGILPLSKSFIEVKSENAAISAIKIPESSVDKTMIVRAYETEGIEGKVEFSFAFDVKDAWFIDINEKTLKCSQKIVFKGNKVMFHISANSIANICIRF